MPASSPATPPVAAPTSSEKTSVSLVGVMCCVMLGPFVNILDYNVVNVSLPKMMSGLATDVLTIRWVVTAFLISTAVSMPTLGWLGRTIGNKNLYILGLVVFTTATGLCSLAPNVNVLIALRVIEGLGAGTLMPMSMVLMLEVYPPEKRGTGVALWSLGASMGSVLGLPLGGYFADAVDWRTVFCVNLLPGALGAVSTFFIVPPSRRESRLPFDVWGFLTLTIVLVSLLVTFSLGQREGWDSASIVTLGMLCGVAFCLFVLIEWWSASPLVDLRLYSSIRYVSATLLALAMGLFFNGSTFLTVLFAQLLLDFSVERTAFALLPGSIAMVLTTPLVGRLIDRADARLPMLLGLAVYGWSCYMMLWADIRVDMAFVVWVYIWRGVGLGFLYPPLFAVATSGLPLQRTRAASSLLNLWVTIGGALSIALLSTLVEMQQIWHQARLAEDQMPTAVGTQQGVATLTRLLTETGSGVTGAGLQALGLLQGLLQREALVRSINDCFMLILLVTVACVGLTMLVRMVRHH